MAVRSGREAGEAQGLAGLSSLGSLARSRTWSPWKGADLGSHCGLLGRAVVIASKFWVTAVTQESGG